MTPLFSIAAVPLWLAPALLLLIAAAQLLPRRSEAKHSFAVVFGPLASFVLIAPGARAAWSGETVLTLGPRLARVGQIDLSLGMALDRMSLVAAACVAIASTGALFVATSRPAPGSSARALAIVAAVLTGVLADGFPTLVLAALAVLALSPIAADAPRAALGRFFGLATASVLAIALGAALLFWALGGRWLDGIQYFADYDARFVIAGEKAEKPEKGASRLSSPTAQGTLTMVSHPGAKIYDGVADEAQLTRSVPIAVSPAIRVPIVAGLHKIAIAPGDAAVIAGDGLEVALIDIVDIREGKESVVVIAGPTMTFHEITPQLAKIDVFVQRRLSKIPAAAAITAAFLVSLLLAAFALRERLEGVAGALAGGGLLAVLSIAVARVAPIVVATPAIGLLVSAIAAAAAVMWALPALRKSARPSRIALLAPLAALATATASTAPVAPLCAAASIMLAVALFTSSGSSPATPQASPTAETPKKKKKKKAAETPELVELASSPGGLLSPSSLARAAIAGAPLPGGAFVLGGTGVACAFAGMGAGNALAALAVVVTWIATAAFTWRAASTADRPKDSQVPAVVALLLGLGAALALTPWNVPSNVSRDARIGLALLAFGIVTAIALRARALVRSDGSQPPKTGDDERASSPAAVLSLVGRTLDRAIGAPLDLLVLPFSRRAAPAPDKERRS